MLVCVTAGALGLAFLLGASVPRPPRGLRWAILAAFLAQLAGYAFLWLQVPGQPYTDTGLYVDLAGELFRRGQNPYTWEYGGAPDLYRAAYPLFTPRLNGSVGGVFPYPALGFLLVAALQMAGLPGSFMLGLLAHGAALALLFVMARRALQPLVLLPLAVGFELAPITLVGSYDAVWAALLVACVAAWRRPWPRALLFGLAACVKQTPWILAPFLLVRVWKEEGRRGAGVFGGVAATVWLAVNGPFLVWEPRAWLTGLLEPVREAYIMYAQGTLASFSHFGLIRVPRGYYAVAAVTALAALVVCYWALYDRLRDACWVLPAPAYWLTYRPLTLYWVFWLLPALAVIASRPLRPRPVASERAPRWRVAAIALAGCGGVVVAGLAWTAVPPTVTVAVRGPLSVADGRVVRMSVDVTNMTPHAFAPRLAVQSIHALFNSQPWQTEDGPLTLEPHATATYRIASYRDDRTFFPFETAQVVVTDAAGDYTVRGVTTVDADRSLLFPGVVMNPSFRYWHADGGAPFAWTLESEPRDAGTATPVRHDGRDAVELALTSRRAVRLTLSTQIESPARPLRVPAAVGPGATAAVILDDGPSRVRVELPPGPGWVEHDVDFGAAYARAGLARASPGAVPRKVRLSLELVGHGPARAWFGPIVGDSRP